MKRHEIPTRLSRIVLTYQFPTPDACVPEVVETPTHQRHTGERVLCGGTPDTVQYITR